MTPVALTIAGSDSSGGAGIQADLKTFTAFGVYGAAVLTALTAQNTRGVHGVFEVPADFVTGQIDAVLSDLTVGAVKTGMLATPAIVSAVARALRGRPALPAIVDPVMVAASGDPLLVPEAIAAIRRDLIPRADLVTPNLAEAARLADAAEATGEAEMAAQARAIAGLGARAVLIKGGHARTPQAVDILLFDGSIVRLERPRLDTPHTHGTGCTLSAAIAALIACGVPWVKAVERAKDFVWRGLEHGRRLGIGHGRGPLDHLYAIRIAPPPA
ncbi:MAG: bifunctional hydroxymethylpyrimidine kinase/phosphomethylpyrimidine kinase [Hyphomicrobiaceae bacterium]